VQTPCWLCNEPISGQEHGTPIPNFGTVVHTGCLALETDAARSGAGETTVVPRATTENGRQTT
jgi:hypothetical protein